MAGVFGNHQLAIPYRPIAELLAKYKARDPRQDRDRRSRPGQSITFGALDQVTTDIAAFLQAARASGKGSRVLLLSDEMLEKLLIWFGVWRIGAVVCPLNIEINEQHDGGADRQRSIRR